MTSANPLHVFRRWSKKGYMDFQKESLKDFLDATASSAPTPGGGGVSAYAAALGTALSDMVGSLTVGKKKYADVEEEILQLKEKAKALEEELLSLASEDAKAFEPLAAAYRLPKETEEERRHKDQVMEECLLAAAEVPLRIMEKCCSAIELAEEFAKKGSRLALSDAGVSASLLGGALKGASLNVFINTAAMKNREVAEKLNNRANTMLDAYVPRADAVFDLVKSEL